MPLKMQHLKSNAKVAVGGFIGFIPFGFGNDKSLVWFIVKFYYDKKILI